MKYRHIASRCREYCSVARAQDFGISFLNSLDTVSHPDCRFCINWNGGDCDIFNRYDGL
jgi:hypothetical protein